MQYAASPENRWLFFENPVYTPSTQTPETDFRAGGEARKLYSKNEGNECFEYRVRVCINVQKE